MEIIGFMIASSCAIFGYFVGALMARQKKEVPLR